LVCGPMQVAMTLLTHCGKALLALEDMEQVVHYLKAEVASCTAHIYTHTHTTYIHDAYHFVHAASGEVRIRDTAYLIPTYFWLVQLKTKFSRVVWSLMANSLSTCYGVESVS